MNRDYVNAYWRIFEEPLENIKRKWAEDLDAKEMLSEKLIKLELQNRQLMEKNIKLEIENKNLTEKVENLNITVNMLKDDVTELNDRVVSSTSDIQTTGKRRRTTSGASTSSIESLTRNVKRMKYEPLKKQEQVSVSTSHIAIATNDGYIKVYLWDSLDKPLFQETFN